jgi:hypothetical protein
MKTIKEEAFNEFLKHDILFSNANQFNKQDYQTCLNAGFDSRNTEVELLEAQIKDLLFDDTQNFKHLKTENDKLKELLKEGTGEGRWMMYFQVNESFWKTFFWGYKCSHCGSRHYFKKRHTNSSYWCPFCLTLLFPNRY